MRSSGSDIVFAPKGLSDIDIGVLAKKEGRIILSHDHDFTDLSKFPPKDFPGIVWLSLNPPTLENVVRSLESLLVKLKPEDFVGKLIVIFGPDRFHVIE